MVEPLGAPGTRWAIGARLTQALLAAAAAAIMASTHDFLVVTAFSYFIAATTVQFLWSLSLAAVDLHALLVKRSFRTPLFTSVFFIGDWVTGALTFAAAIGSAAITVLIDADMRMCSENHCRSFRVATTLAFLSWFTTAPSCLLNLWAAVHRLQGP